MVHNCGENSISRATPASEHWWPTGWRNSNGVIMRRQLSWLHLQDRAALDPDHQAVLDRLVMANAAIPAAYTLAKDFRHTVKARQAEAFAGWLETVTASDLLDPSALRRV